MLRQEIIPFTDGDGLISCDLSNGAMRSSDNGPLFTSIYYVLLKHRKEWIDSDFSNFEKLIQTCMIRPGCLSRSPGDTGQEAPDDYHGVLGACTYFGIQSIPRSVFLYGLKHFGNFNNSNPWKLTGESFLWRMPQLIFLAYMGCGGWYWLLYPVMLPFMFYTALLIATSCIRTPNTDTDARHLSWFLILGTQKSFLCRMAAKLWWRRLRVQYGDEGLRAVDSIYFSRDNHPFPRYQVNPWDNTF